MFETISKGFRAARERITGQAELTDEVITAALKDVRLSLLEADVEFGVVKGFLKSVREKALGEKVQLVAKSAEKKMRVKPEDHFVKICHDELVDLMGPVDTSINRARKGVSGIMMVGLQGSGKTTTCGKLARKLQKAGYKVMLVAADVYRPAAVHQLKVLGEQLGIKVYHEEGANPVDICANGTDVAAVEGCDFIIYDTAGRLTIDEPLMQELVHIETRVQPANVFLVIDAMIGQDAVTTAKAFDARLTITGIVLTKLDGDARGGAALSIKATTGKPIKFLGMGESLDKLEEFRPEGLAGRILGMGDLVGLMRDFEDVVDEEQAAKDAAKMMSGKFTMDDFLNQIKTIQSMGSLKDIVQKMPLGNMFGIDIPQEQLEAAADDKELVKIEAMIRSMTRDEKAEPELFLKAFDEPKASAKLSRRHRRPDKPDFDPSQLGPGDFVASRVRRVARGSGRKEDEVQALVGRFMAMRDMFGMFGNLLGGMPGMPGGGGGGLMDKIPGAGMFKQLNAMRKLMQNPQAMQGLMGGMGGGMPGLGGMGGMGGQGQGGQRQQGPSASQRYAQVAAKRKKARDSKKKNRK
ncbi:MAG: signal recognition particle protein [Myxococcales bacterium]|nr:signal recognition particle protein [Myxococcales bacterium]